MIVTLTVTIKSSGFNGAKVPVILKRGRQEIGRKMLKLSGAEQQVEIEFTPKEIWDVAERCNMIERLFNLREGLSRDDLKKGDTLNHRYFDEPCRRGAPDVIGKKIDRDKFKQMIDEFYQHKGLDPKGAPKPDTLARLGLESEPSHLV